jgi:hypothetical protein
MQKVDKSSSGAAEIWQKQRWIRSYYIHRYSVLNYCHRTLPGRITVYGLYFEIMQCDYSLGNILIYQNTARHDLWILLTVVGLKILLLFLNLAFPEKIRQGLNNMPKTELQ